MGKALDAYHIMETQLVLVFLPFLLLMILPGGTENTLCVSWGQGITVTILSQQHF